MCEQIIETVAVVAKLYFVSSLATKLPNISATNQSRPVCLNKKSLSVCFLKLDSVAVHQS